MTNNNTNIDWHNIPRHIAIIMDGNGRWARKQGLDRTIGHQQGVETVKKITELCARIGVKYPYTLHFLYRKLETTITRSGSLDGARTRLVGRTNIHGQQH